MQGITGFAHPTTSASTVELPPFRYLQARAGTRGVSLQRSVDSVAESESEVSESGLGDWFQIRGARAIRVKNSPF
jgi:hypothetical protein